MRSIIGCLALLVALTPLPSNSQEAGALTVAVVSEEPGDTEFTASQLEDAGVVVFKAKMPNIVISDSADLWLHLQPNCLSLTARQGYACSVTYRLFSWIDWGAPFANSDSSIVVWTSGGTLLVGPPGSALRRIREWLGTELDRPIAAWLRLSSEERRCWSSYLGQSREPVNFDYSHVVGDITSAPGALWGGPCGAARLSSSATRIDDNTFDWTDIEDDRARFRWSAEVINESEEQALLQVSLLLLDAEDRVICWTEEGRESCASYSVVVELGPSEKRLVDQEGSIRYEHAAEVKSFRFRLDPVGFQSP